MERTAGPSTRAGKVSARSSAAGLTKALPLIRGHRPGAPFAVRGGKEIAVGQYLRDVANLSLLLPETHYVLNACSDRYCFAVALGAALMRGQSSLLPPNRTSDLLEQLRRRYPGLYCLGDSAVDHPGMESVVVPPILGEGGPDVPVPAFPEDQPAAIVFTSGSTGEPMPQAKSWGSLVRSAIAEVRRLRARPGTVLLATIQPQHMYGFESTVLMAIQGGLALHAERLFFPADICDELARLPRPRALVSTPVHLSAVLAETGAPPAVDFLLCATAPLAPQLAAEAELRFQAPLYEIYGCTETGQIATRRTVNEPDWRALPGVTLRQDARGTWASGGHVRGEVLLGDVIELRGRERFRLHGRTTDMINVAGKRSSLSHLDYHLNSIKGVRDGAFVMPSEQSNGVTRLMAFVVAPGMSRDAVMRALRQRIDSAFLPRPLLLVDALPRNETGKLPRAAVEQMLARVPVKSE